MCRQLRTLALALCTTAVAGSASAADAVDFSAKVQPIFAAHCSKCHGADRQQAKLRLDSADAIAEFTKDTLLVAGKPDESELLKRITLPADDRKRMPKGADPLSADEVAIVRQWIAEGAQFTAATPATDVADAPAEAHEPAPRGEDDPELQALEPASAETIAKIEAAGASVMPLYGDSPLLQVSFARAESPPGDEAVAALTGAADQIVWLNLDRAQLSDAGFASIAQLKNLIQLHLERSTVNDASLARLAGLERLEYLNLYGTAVTDAGLEHLKNLAKLRRLYVWQTKVSYDAAQKLQEAVPRLEVNLGWDHPQVVKKRVAQELVTAKAIAKDAETRAAELEKQFNAAKEAKDQAAARLKQLEDQLKALDAPAEEPNQAAEPEKKSAPEDDKAA